MLKRLFAPFLLALALAACATDPVVTETLAMQSVTSARQLSTAALRAGKITLAADQKNQSVLTITASAIKAAAATNDTTTLAAQKAQADSVAATLKAQ